MRKDAIRMNRTTQRDILTVEQTADLLQSSRHMIYTLIRRGDLKAGRIGGKYWRIARSQVLRLCGDSPERLSLSDTIGQLAATYGLCARDSERKPTPKKKGR